MQPFVSGIAKMMVSLQNSIFTAFFTYIWFNDKAFFDSESYSFFRAISDDTQFSSFSFRDRCISGLCSLDISLSMLQVIPMFHGLASLSLIFTFLLGSALFTIRPRSSSSGRVERFQCFGYLAF
jgi:hypothetical protein